MEKVVKSLMSYFYRVGAWAGLEMPPEMLLACAVHFRDVARFRGTDRPDDKLKAKSLITLALEAGAINIPILMTHYGMQRLTATLTSPNY